MAGALHACPADPTEDDSAQTLVRMPLKMGYNAHSSGHREEGTIIAWSSVVLPQTLTQKMEIKLMGKNQKPVSKIIYKLYGGFNYFRHQLGSPVASKCPLFICR